MTQALALRIAALVYLVLSTLFAIALIAGSALTEKIVTGGQQTSLAVFTTVAISLAVWTWRVQRKSAKLSFPLYLSSFGAGPVIGVGLGKGFLIPLLFSIPFVFVAIAWNKAQKKQANDRT